MWRSIGRRLLADWHRAADMTMEVMKPAPCWSDLVGEPGDACADFVFAVAALSFQADFSPLAQRAGLP